MTDSAARRSATAPTPLLDGFAERLTAIGVALDEFTATGSDAVPRREEWQAALSGPLPEGGVGADSVLAELADVVVPNGTRLMAPGWWGYITNGPTTVPLVASVAAAVGSPQRYTITAFNLLEEQSLEWLADLCGLPPHLKGVYSSGGSVANLVALGAARQHAGERHGVDPGADGLGGLRLAVYASDETHHTVQRAAGVLGLGRASVRHVGTDPQLRMRPDLLEAAIAADVADGVVPMAVVATAGTTNTGSIDDLRTLGVIAHDAGAWFHVDGAYGLPGILDERVTEHYDGLELADSAIVDPHKWLGAPIGIGATFVRDRALLHRAFTQEPAAYLEMTGGADGSVESSLDSMGVPYADFGVELSAQARGVVVWSILRELGRAGVTARVRADNDLARRVAVLAREHPRLELLLDPVLSVCCFRYLPDEGDPDAVNAEILRRLHRSTGFIPSSTRVGESFALRPCFINPRTTPDLVDAFVAAVVDLGDEIVAGR
ncbi:MAG TPA: aminotransferase class V-fold PLP-dependent enzyme [Candidatus Angelobacter sp.]|nr:aminotransferase class V-fold PLP-dependent enzyme [Candidatus Angelobacter sp.]